LVTGVDFELKRGQSCSEYAQRLAISAGIIMAPVNGRNSYGARGMKFMLMYLILARELCEVLVY